MVDCKDCIHYPLCESYLHHELRKDNCEGELVVMTGDNCMDFTDKSEYIHLPCKVGNYLYTNSTMQGWYMRKRNAPYRVKIVFIGLNTSEKMGGGFFNVLYENDGMLEFYFSDIGKTIFFTYEEAEQALKERD